MDFVFNPLTLLKQASQSRLFKDLTSWSVFYYRCEKAKTSERSCLHSGGCTTEESSVTVAWGNECHFAMGDAKEIVHVFLCKVPKDFDEAKFFGGRTFQS